jgi:branched-chain amino acid transport system permease protein
MTKLVQLLISGLTVGATYALIALGFSLVWATLRSVNFAHGDLYTIGAYVSLGIGNFVVAAAAGWPPAVVLVAAVVLSAIAGSALSVGIERAIFKPLRDAPEAVPILATLGFSIIIQNALFLRYGAAFNSFPINIPRGGFDAGAIKMNVMQLAFIVIVAAVVFGLTAFLRRTKLGVAMRATSWDRETVSLMGVNPDKLIIVAFAIAGALAGMAGAFVAVYYGVITFFMGFIAAVKGFTAAVFGGFGNLNGALMGGFLLGIFEALAAGYGAGQWKDAIAFLLLLLVILVRPTGIVGERLPAKV